MTQIGVVQGELEVPAGVLSAIEAGPRRRAGIVAPSAPRVAPGGAPAGATAPGPGLGRPWSGGHNRPPVLGIPRPPPPGPTADISRSADGGAALGGVEADRLGSAAAVLDEKDRDGEQALAAEAGQQKALFKHNVKPIKIHDAEGFGPGAFFVDNTISPTVSSVQLHLIDNGYLMMVQVLNPKDFASGEQQAAAVAKQAFASIKNKSAYKTI